MNASFWIGVLVGWGIVTPLTVFVLALFRVASDTRRSRSEVISDAALRRWLDELEER